MHFLKNQFVGILSLLALVTYIFIDFSLHTHSQPETHLPTPSQYTSANYRHAVNIAKPSVVEIYTTHLKNAPQHPLSKNPSFKEYFNAQNIPNKQRLESSLGSGVIFSTDGIILTNYHVIKDATEIKVSLANGEEHNATIIGKDIESDLAILKINANNLTAIDVADKSDVHVGDIVLAIGNPFGVGQTVTAGIISAINRNKLGLATFENFIQTDAAINPGNSGGALVNTHGKLIGINTAIFSKSGGSQGIGFAIPVSMVNMVVNDIIKHGKVIRGWLGVRIELLNKELAAKFNLPLSDGLVVTNKLKGGPADVVGMEVGDIILAVNDQQIEGDYNESLHTIANTAPGKQVKLRILRNGNEYEIHVTVGTRPEEK